MIQNQNMGDGNLDDEWFRTKTQKMETLMMDDPEPKLEVCSWAIMVYPSLIISDGAHMSVPVLLCQFPQNPLYTKSVDS
jgi:hypothetical protein